MVLLATDAANISFTFPKSIGRLLGYRFLMPLLHATSCLNAPLTKFEVLQSASTSKPPCDLWEFDSTQFSPHTANKNLFCDRALEILADFTLHLELVSFIMVCTSSVDHHVS